MTRRDAARSERPSSDPLDAAGFERLVVSLAPPLRLHCYRLVGSLDDAEDMVQETFVRAWQGRHRLADTSGLRPWLYRIATNACLDLLDRRRRRTTIPGHLEAGWPDPFPDAWLVGAEGDADPQDNAVRRESVGLAFLAAVQLLPPRQRAILILRDVLDWSTTEVAEALETTAPAVHSALQRARTSIRERLPAGCSDAPSGPVQAHARELAERYLDAWDRADSKALADLLTIDARMAMPPDPRMFEGSPAIARYFDAEIFSRPPERRLRILPTRANRGPAFLVLEPVPATGRLRRIGVKVLSLRGRRIAEIRGYMRADLAARFAGTNDGSWRDDVAARSAGGRPR